MTGGEIDRRAERTRQAIRQAFVDLLAEHGFRKLTIQKVITRANVGRSTFYEHYRTKHDLLSQSLAEPFGVLAAIVGSRLQSPSLVLVLQHFRDNQALGRELFLPSTRPLVGRVLANCIEPKLAELCDGQKQASPIVPLGLIAQHLAEAQLCIVESWVLGRVACRAEQIALALFASCHACTVALLRLGPPEGAEASDEGGGHDASALPNVTTRPV